MTSCCGVLNNLSFYGIKNNRQRREALCGMGILKNIVLRNEKPERESLL